jgi:7-cyano-7-deazaguanine tRNA-ribosyltransferase
MPITFEVRETDLMGRTGILRVGGKSVETPCLVPVIHPVNQDIPLSTLTQMGFGALMTNSLITYRRRQQEALEKGLHKMLDYSGVIMTDSGGYQVLVYGQQDITPSIIAKFQSGIGSDLAVTLDRPTGYSHSREHAEETMEVSLKGSRETIRKFGESKTTWVGPIQGGLFDDLVQDSTRKLLRSGFEILALGSPVEMMDSYLFRDLVRMIIAAKKAMPFSVPLHLFGAGHPLTLPLSVALGCDTFDSASYILFAKQGRYMTERGTLLLEEMTYLPCSCPACNSTTRSDLVLMERRERVNKLALHNLYLLRQDVLRCKQAIAEGRLWDLVEERASVHPRVATAFKEIAENREWLEGGTPFLKERGLLIRSDLDLKRPELAITRSHLEPIIKKRSQKAILLPEENEKPIFKSSAYRKVAKLTQTGKYDVYKVHPVLGAYPAELDFVYPFTQTVTDNIVGAKELRAAKARLRAIGYRTIVVCRARPRALDSGQE